MLKVNATIRTASSLSMVNIVATIRTVAYAQG